MIKGVWDFTHLCYLVTLRATLPFILRYVCLTLCYAHVPHTYDTYCTAYVVLQYTLCHYVVQHNLCCA
jgi:hypothetical protein